MEYIVKINTEQDLTQDIEAYIEKMVSDLVRFGVLDYNLDIDIQLINS